MGVISKRQKPVIEDIEKKLGIKYEGQDSHTHAERFITKHISALRKYNQEHKIPAFMSRKQFLYIQAIEKDGRVKFIGKTAAEASDFIEKYKYYATFDSPPRVYF
jgi:hypothetical protein